MPKLTPQTKKPKLTDAERHKRFVDMAREVEADDRSEAFDDAFNKVAKVAVQPPGKPSRKAP